MKEAGSIVRKIDRRRNLVEVLLMRSQGAEFFLLGYFCQALLQYLANQYLQQRFNLSVSSSSAWSPELSHLSPQWQA